MDPEMMKKLKVALLIMTIATLGALTYLYLTVPPAESCSPDYGKLKVKVTDEYNNVVWGANVSVWWMGELMRTGLTDNEGNIAFPHLYWDWYNITVSKKGLELDSLYFHFDESVTKVFSLSYLNFTLLLNITDSDTGGALENASVQLYRYDYLEQYEEFTTYSNSSGLVSPTDLEYDEYTLVISKFGYYIYTALIFMDADIHLTITLQREVSDPPEDPPDGGIDLNGVIIGVAIGIIIACLAMYLVLLQRKLPVQEY